MTAANKSLLINLARNAPWLIEGGNSLFPETLQGSVSELLGGIRDNRLTIITDDGQVYEQYQSLEITNGEIRLEKPAAWQDSTASFHVFFKNRDNTWNFFLAQNGVCYPTALLIETPESIFSLQRRRYKRALAPVGTKAIFKGSGNHLNSAHVQDISEGGMRICIASTKDNYPADSIINEIFITIPPKTRKDRTNVGRTILPLISSGKVVRIFYDLEHSVSCYGISFSCDSTYVKESVRRLLFDLTEDLPRSLPDHRSGLRHQA